jgi:hypothetical protein
MANTPKAFSKLIERQPTYNATPIPEYVTCCRLAHRDAAMNPRPGFERAMARMLRGWLEYAETHETRYETPVVDGSFIGPAWEAIGGALRTLLNGECGRLDCGTVDGILLDAMKGAGIDTEVK